jgi:hypothetical protein
MHAFEQHFKCCHESLPGFLRGFIFPDDFDSLVFVIHINSIGLNYFAGVGETLEISC